MSGNRHLGFESRSLRLVRCPSASHGMAVTCEGRFCLSHQLRQSLGQTRPDFPPLFIPVCNAARGRNPFVPKTKASNRTRTIRVHLGTEKIESCHFPLTVVIAEVTVAGNDTRLPVTDPLHDPRLGCAAPKGLTHEVVPKTVRTRRARNRPLRRASGTCPSAGVITSRTRMIRTVSGLSRPPRGP